MAADFNDILTANAAFAKTFTDPGVPGRAGIGLGVITCMDSRIDPLAVLGLELGQAKIVRTAGGRVTPDAERAMVIAHSVLGVDRVLVLQHTQCGMTKADDDAVRALIEEKTAASAAGFVPGTFQDPPAALREDVERLRANPLLGGIPVAGGRYDVETGAITVEVG